MRKMIFNMERSNLVKVGDKVKVSEGNLPSSYYYTIEPSIAMSANYRSWERLKTREGVVTEIEETLKGILVTVAFDEDEISERKASSVTRVWNYIYSCFEALHTTGENYIVEDIDLYIEARQQAMT